MPIYKADEMKETPDVKRPHISMIQYGGDLIKAGLVTYYEGDAPPPHYHPNDEQWIYLLEDKCRFFTCKSPAGTGGLSEDYQPISNLDEITKKLNDHI